MEVSAYRAIQQYGLLPAPMNTALIAFQIIGAAIPGQIDRVCSGTYCQTIAVRDGIVRLVDSTPPSRNLVIGRYIEVGRSLVPSTEAPIRDLRSARGWRVVVSAYLDHDEGEIKLRLRFFDPTGALRTTDDVLSALEQVELRHLFGGTDEILAITSAEEHAYNVETELWFLPERASPKRLLWIRGVFQNFSTVGQAAGVAIARQTYDGEHAETKGTVQEFYTWDRERKTLTLQKQ